MRSMCLTDWSPPE